ncbi:MAG: hypothetical protein WBA43_11825 [Elainellaceae cyanobacterium]|jgi:hypothetical protein
MYGSKQGDARVKRMLDSLDIHYSVDQDDDFEVAVAFEDGRSQLAFVNSETQFIGDFEIREVWSVGYVTQGFLDIDTANTLLLENDFMKIGSWRLKQVDDNTFAAVYCIQIAADCDPQSFVNTLKLVLRVADEMEEKLTGRDNL